MLKRFLKDTSGATAVVFALAMPVFIGGIVFAVELGHWHQETSKLQDITDNAAVAAAQELYLMEADANFEFAGKGHAFENGYDFTQGNITVHSPPISGNYAGKNGVEVVAVTKQETYLAKYFGIKAFDQETRATVLLMDGTPACLLALSETASPGFEVTGNSTIDVDGCKIHANSGDPNAIDIGDKNNLTADCISASGGITTGQGTTLTACSGAKPYTAPVRDPYRDMDIVENVPSMPCLTPTKKKWDRYLKPGRYCSRVRASGAVFLEEPGVYIFDGADLEIASQYAWLWGRGVTIIFMNGGLFTSGNGGYLDVTPQTTGPYAGITFFYDRDTTPLGTQVKINGNANSTMEGVIYGPTIDLTYNGGATGYSECLQIITNTVTFAGTASLTNTGCEGLGVDTIGGQGGVALVE